MAEKTDMEAEEWGMAVGLLVGLLTGLGFFISNLTWQLGGLLAAFLVGVFAGGIAGYVVGWLVYAAVSFRNGVRSGMRQVRKVQTDAAKQRARKERQERERALGPRNAAFVESTLTAIQQIAGSEAARKGWLGDVDFSSDVQSITDNFRRSHELRQVADKLSGLDNPGADDRRILTEAKIAMAKLDTAALKRVELIANCATEARLIDDSLRKERADTLTAEQRAELHAKLSGMLYGIEAAPDTSPTESAAADAVMARVQAYREIKNQIQRARDE
jgi:hypothetical protein